MGATGDARSRRQKTVMATEDDIDGEVHTAMMMVSTKTSSSSVIHPISSAPHDRVALCDPVEVDLMLIFRVWTESRRVPRPDPLLPAGRGDDAAGG